MSQSKVKVDFSENKGKIKAMNAVNNGPLWKRRSNDNYLTNMPYYTDARIPYARTHDASVCYEYGGEHIVDVGLIFKDFEADPCDPASYDFELTDYYLETILRAGTKPFYRLGSKIEHWKKKYNVIPPSDYNKWAVICEHIIRHMNYGWADGHEYGIEYWEIWNEPNGNYDDDPLEYKLNWGGTCAEFMDFYVIVHRHLKTCFPELKIGGPAFCSIDTETPILLERLAKEGLTYDFYSWHGYTSKPWQLVENAFKARELLDKYGFTKTENINDEWNYINDWSASDIRALTSQIGSAFICATMCSCQDTPLDMMMYYDAQPSALNGLFDFYTREPLKGYYPISWWSDLRELGGEVGTEIEGEKIYAMSATDGEKAATLLCYYDDSPDAEKKSVTIEFKDRPAGVYTVYAVNAEHNGEALLSTNGSCLTLELNPNTVLMIK